MNARTRQIMWPELFRLSAVTGCSLQQRIRETLVAAILDGRLPPDTPVPSGRELARELGVARNTVTFAYQRLVEDGFLIARERSGYFINPDMQPSAPGPTPDIDSAGSASDTTPGAAGDAGGGIDWDARMRLKPSAQRNIIKRSNWRQFEFPFIYGQVDPGHFPLNAWRECYRQALSVQAVDSLVRDQMDADDPLLVEQIQTRVLPRRGIWVDPDQILVTLGAQNALYLLAELLIGPRDVVGIEDPGYPDARNILSLKTSDMRPLPVDEHGLATDAAALGACDYVFVTPSHQSPTTVTLPMERRKGLLEKAAESDFMIIEDDYESEITFSGTPSPALKSFDDHGRVLYLGSLSKTLDPGLRMGFLVGPRDLIREARALRRLMLRHPPANNQHAVALFLSLGHHDALIQRMTQAYRERWQTLGEALERHLPEASHSPSCGGSSYWVAGPDGLDARELARRAAEQSVFIEAGDVTFFSDDPPLEYFRLGFSAIDRERIAPGVERLGHIVADLCG